MAKIDNISRTLVLEKFTDKAASLKLALIDAVDPDDGSFNYRKVNIKDLVVKNFEEFLDKFAPEIYQGFQTDENGGYFVYSTDPEKYPGSLPMKFEKTAFFKAAVDMYEKKAVDGKSNYEFDYSCFSKLISPETALKEVKSKRRELEFAMHKMLEAKDSRNTALTSQYKKKILNVVDDINKTYKDNPTALLCLSLADLQVKLGISDDGKSSNVNNNQIGSQTVYRLTYNSEGDILKEKVITETVNNSGINPASILETRVNNETVKLLESKIKTDDNSSEGDVFARNLVISVYAGNTGTRNDDSKETEKLKRRYEIQKSCYKAAQDSLLKAINKIIEKMIDVKALFDNAECDFEVVISNCTADELVSDSTIKDYFTRYMENINGNISDKIWFSVLPQIDDEDLVDRESAGKVYTPDIPDADFEGETVIDADFKSESEELFDDTEDGIDWNDEETETVNQDLISLTTAKQILCILERAKCTTFFGFKGCEKTGFSKMNKSKLEQYKRKLDGINSCYAVFAYPNFTLMSGIQAGDIQVAAGETIQNPGLYLDAPYIAAGVTVKSLNSKILEKKKFNVHKELPMPCVRFDFEDSSDDYANRSKITTNMNCEEILKYDKDLLEELDDKPFGFFFDSCGYYNGAKLKNAFVKYSRNLSDKENRIFATLVKDFIWLEMVNGELRINKKSIDKYKSENKWNRYEDYINNPLKKGEEYGYKDVNGKLTPFIHFNGGNESIKFDDFEIIDDTEE